MLRRRLTARLPCVTGPADTQPLGNRLGLDCCRRQGRPAGYHVGATITGPPPPGGVHPPQLQLLRPMAPPVPEPAAAPLGPDRLRLLVAKPAPPRLYSSSVWLAAAGFNKGIPFLSGCEAGGHQPLVLTAEAEGGWWRCCRVHDATHSSSTSCNAAPPFSLSLLTLPPPPPPPPLATKDQTESPCISNH